MGLGGKTLRADFWGPAARAAVGTGGAASTHPASSAMAESDFKFDDSH